VRKREANQIYTIINNTFREITLTFAGLALENNFKDEIITDFSNCLEDIYYQTLNQLEKLTKKTSYFELNTKEYLHPHPAIKELLKIFNLRPENGS
jgi:hypothetical protein